MSSGRGAHAPIQLIRETIDGFLAEPEAVTRAGREAEAVLPGEQLKNLQAILEGAKGQSYRSGVVVQLAFGALGEKDLTVRAGGARAVAGKLGRYSAEKHIPSVQDAFQNIGKNTTTLVRGNFAEWDSFLQWASEEGRRPEEIRAAFNYACAHLAASARPILQFPDLDWGRLTFARFSNLVSDLLSQGTQGAYEQFLIAALLQSLIESAGLEGYRVETKSLNAADRSSRSAGDIQVLAGNRVVEAFEVTAGPAAGKLPGASRAIREHDLSRLHIVAKGSKKKEILDLLLMQAEDIAVLEVEQLAGVITAALTRQYRAHALHRLYEFLDRYQPEAERVNRFVRLLSSHGLTAG
jgi:hypothetical protein